VILIVLGAIVGGYRLRVQSLEARGRHLESQVQQRTAELRHEAMQRAQVEEALRVSEREKAVTAERNRLARALHDSVTQSLYSLTLLAAGWQRLAKDGELDSIEEPLGEIGEVAQQALKEMRLLVHELRPPALEKEGLLGAIHHRLGAVEKRAGIEARLEAEDILELPSEVEAALYYIVVEALNNALKHAQATSVWVRLFNVDEKVELEIADNGQGFDLSAIGEHRGLGLVSMQERADQLGALLSIDSAPGKGTRVKVEVLL
jgi:signal transduction histidine kinase